MTVWPILKFGHLTYSVTEPFLGLVLLCGPAKNTEISRHYEEAEVKNVKNCLLVGVEFRLTVREPQLRLQRLSRGFRSCGDASWWCVAAVAVQVSASGCSVKCDTPCSRGDARKIWVWEAVRMEKHRLLACHTPLHCCAQSVWGPPHVRSIYEVKVFALHELFII